MKHFRTILTSVFFVLIVSFQAFGATITYSPVLSITVPPGSQTEIPLTISIADMEDTIYYAWFVDSVEGSIPMSWLQAQPIWCFLSSSSNSDSTTLRISVPEGTPSGTYSGQIFSKAMSSHGDADLGDGVYLEINVPSGCNGGPVVQIISVEPSYLWPPNGRTEPVTITGNILQPDGCSLYEAGYIIEDEYGELSGMATFPVYSDGGFQVQVPFVVSRGGSDTDGRSYRITIYAENEAGIGNSESIDVIVHDQGQN